MDKDCASCDDGGADNFGSDSRLAAEFSDDIDLSAGGAVDSKVGLDDDCTGFKLRFFSVAAEGCVWFSEATSTERFSIDVDVWWKMSFTGDCGLGGVSDDVLRDSNDVASRCRSSDEAVLVSNISLICETDFSGEGGFDAGLFTSGGVDWL